MRSVLPSAQSAEEALPDLLHAQHMSGTMQDKCLEEDEPLHVPCCAIGLWRALRPAIEQSVGRPSLLAHRTCVMVLAGRAVTAPATICHT